MKTVQITFGTGTKKYSYNTNDERLQVGTKFKAVGMHGTLTVKEIITPAYSAVDTTTGELLEEANSSSVSLKVIEVSEIVE
jgi:hypothetical protein